MLRRRQESHTERHGSFLRTTTGIGVHYFVSQFFGGTNARHLVSPLGPLGATRGLGMVEN